MTLILASGSAARRRMLEAAGLNFEIIAPAMDEEVLKAELRADGRVPREQAMVLAERKALSVSRTRSGLVIGADQMLALGDEIFDKPADAVAARDHLLRLRGRTHELLTAAVVAHNDSIVWRRLEAPVLTMRAFSQEFLEAYLAGVGERVLHSVGAYQLEGLGAQLFDSVEGDYFSMLGLPLLPLLAFLREQGVAPT